MHLYKKWKLSYSISSSTPDLTFMICVLYRIRAQIISFYNAGFYNVTVKDHISQ